VEFATRRIEGVLLFFRAVVDQWSAVGMNRLAKKSLRSDLSQRWRVVQVADNFSTQYPEIAMPHTHLPVSEKSWSALSDTRKPVARSTEMSAQLLILSRSPKGNNSPDFIDDAIYRQRDSQCPSPD